MNIPSREEGAYSAMTRARVSYPFWDRLRRIDHRKVTFFRAKNGCLFLTFERTAESVFFRPVGVEAWGENCIIFYGCDEMFDPSVFSNGLLQSCNDEGDNHSTFLPQLCPRPLNSETVIVPRRYTPLVRRRREPSLWHIRYRLSLRTL